MDQTLTTFVCKENHEDLLVLTQLVEAGKVTPVIVRTYTLADTPHDPFQRLLSWVRGLCGKGGIHVPLVERNHI